MILRASLLMSVLLSQSTADAQQPSAAPSPPEWIVVAAVPVYLPDGGLRAETIALPASGAGLVHLFSRKSQCEPAAAGATEPADAAFGWRIASQIVTRAEGKVVVALDWRRIWEAGKKVSGGPGGTVQLTLHPGDRIPLDLIANTSPPPDCRAVGLGLEMKLARVPPPAPARSPGALPIGATAGGARPVNAELWLTHASAAGPVQVLHQAVRVAEAGGRFSFAPTSVTTTRGEVNIELTGTIDRFRSPTGGEFFVLSMNRVVSGASLPAAGLTATTGTVVPMPGAGEVLSFEMAGAGGRARVGGAGGAGGGFRSGGPGARSATARPGGGGPVAGAFGQSGRGGGGPNVALVAALLEGHEFSLRLRVTPIN